MRSPLILPATIGFTAVVLGAFGAHALRPALEARHMLHVWETAVLYHLVHAVAILAVALSKTPFRLGKVTGCWTAGITLFSGSLYALALGAPRWIGPITPLGGLLLLAGWALLGLTAWATPRQSD